jgi:DNA-binding HxlR family transcriptional regulator
METLLSDEVITPVECQSNLSHIRDALYVLNGKWKLPLIFTLIDKPMRFNEIQATVAGITPKILSKELKDLEINGFVTRLVYPTTPVTVIYQSTAYSGTLKSVLNELKQWGKQHREKIKQSMRRVDTKEMELASS